MTRMLLDSLYIPWDAWGARARNSRGTRARADITPIWLVGIQILPGIDCQELCTRILLLTVSVFLSLSFFSWASNGVGLLL